MTRLTLHFAILLAAAVCSGVALPSAIAQGDAPASGTVGDRGFQRTMKPDLGGAEIVTQPHLWAFEIQYKPMRMMRVVVKDSATGEDVEKLVWYLVYRVVRRRIDRPADATEDIPVNDDDPEPAPIFPPEFLLIAEGEDGQMVYPDQVIPEAVAAVAKRETDQLLTTVEMMRRLPDPTPEDSNEGMLTGVATWSTVDPETDKFRVHVSGLSNAYRMQTGPDGKPLYLRRVLTQHFFRPGDAIQEDEREIRFDGLGKWEYLPEMPRPEVPVLDPMEVPTPANLPAVAPAANDQPIEP